MADSVVLTGVAVIPLAKKDGRCRGDSGGEYRLKVGVELEAGLYE